MLDYLLFLLLLFLSESSDGLVGGAEGCVSGVVSHHHGALGRCKSQFFVTLILNLRWVDCDGVPASVTPGVEILIS